MIDVCHVGNIKNSVPAVYTCRRIFSWKNLILETSAMRQMWKTKQRGEKAYTSALGQYKKLLHYRQENDYLYDEDTTPEIDNHIKVSAVDINSCTYHMVL